jgi:glucan phosphoethanolaminetransferase (alkaline phosphatase superfamily)
LPWSQGRAGRIFLHFTFTIILVATVLIYLSAFISNYIWGDVLTISMVRTFSSNLNAVLDFIPVTSGRKLALSLAIILCLTSLIFVITAICVFITSQLFFPTQNWLLRGDGFKRKLLLATGILFTIITTSFGLCTVLLTQFPRALYGEPISGFFEFNPASRLMSFDNSRLAAALEDREARLAYRKPTDFKPRNVILIVSDALRADHMGVYGYRRETTPFLSDLYSRKLLHRVNMALSTCSETFCGVASILASRPFHQISSDNFTLHSLLHDQGYHVKFFLSGDHRTWNYLMNFYGPDVDDVYDFMTLRAKDVNDDRNIINALQAVAPATDERNFFYFHLMSSHVSGTKLPAFEKFEPAFSDNMRLFTFWNELAGTQRLDNAITTGRLRDEDLEAVSNRYDNGVLQADFLYTRYSIFFGLNHIYKTASSSSLRTTEMVLGNMGTLDTRDTSIKKTSVFPC